jgi:hypothetical protein
MESSYNAFNRLLHETWNTSIQFFLFRKYQYTSCPFISVQYSEHQFALRIIPHDRRQWRFLLHSFG